MRVEFRPASQGSGIVFMRDDLGPWARIPARVEHRIQVPRRTNLRFQGYEVAMVEHIVAALAGLQIDNCEVGVNAIEMPGCDGSSWTFVKALGEAGVVEQGERKPVLHVTERIRVEQGESWVEALPSATGNYRVEFQLDYPNDPIIGQQSVVLDVSPESFRDELAPCRTFVLEREADTLIRQGLATHVTPQDLLVFGKYGPIENRLRFHNECARHKALDLVGDLALTGCDIRGHIIAHRSSHQLNAALAGELLARYRQEVPMRVSA